MTTSLYIEDVDRKQQQSPETNPVTTDGAATEAVGVVENDEKEAVAAEPLVSVEAGPVMWPGAVPAVAEQASASVPSAGNDAGDRDPAMRKGTGWATFGLGIATLVAGTVVSVLVAIVVAFATGVTVEQATKGDLGVWAVPASVVAQTLVWIAVPLLWARRRSLGGARRFLWFSMKVRDIAYGLGLAFALKAATSVAAMLWLREADAESSSEMWKSILGAQGVGPKVLLLVGVALLTPLAEELLFRGLLFQGPRRWAKGPAGTVLAVVVSSLLFTAAHVQWATVGWRAGLFGFASVLALALVASLLTLRTRRLGGAIWIHFWYNLSGVLAAFLLF